jgi:hypothetical protein
MPGRTISNRFFMNHTQYMHKATRESVLGRLRSVDCSSNYSKLY